MVLNCIAYMCIGILLYIEFLSNKVCSKGHVHLFFPILFGYGLLAIDAFGVTSS